MKSLLVPLLATLACSSRTAPERGPEYTAIVAEQLRGLADQCKIGPGSGEVREVRSCLGPRGALRIDLGPKRHIYKLDISLLVSSAYEARELLAKALPAVISPAALEAINTRLDVKTASLGETTVDGVRVAVTIVGERYTITLAW